jgi:hypothetical protein
MIPFMTAPFVVPPVYATWDATDTDLTGVSSNITLSNGDLTATAGNGAAVRATVPITDGSWYFEYTAATVGANDIVGILDATQQNDIATTGHSGCWGYSLHNGDLHHDGSETGSHGAAISNAEVLGVFVVRSGTSVKLWFEDDGGYVQGDPGAGTSPSLDLTLAQTVWPGIRRTNPNTKIATVNFGETSWSRNPPAGFRALTE